MRGVRQFARHGQGRAAVRALLHEILEVGLQQAKVSAKGDPVDQPPFDVAFESVIAPARGVAGVINEVIRIGRIALEAGLDLGVVAMHIEDIGVDLEAMAQQVGLVAGLGADVALGVEHELAGQQPLTQVEPARLVPARQRRIDRLRRVEPVAQRGVPAPEMIHGSEARRCDRLDGGRHDGGVAVAGVGSQKAGGRSLIVRVPSLGAQADRPAQRGVGQVAVEFAVQRQVSRPVAAVDDVVAKVGAALVVDGIDRRSQRLIVAEAQVVKALVELIPIGAHQPAEAMRLFGTRTQLERLRAAVAILNFRILIDRGHGGPEEGIAPVAVITIFDDRFCVGGDRGDADRIAH